MKLPEGNRVHILGRFPLDLLIDKEDLVVYLGHGFCVLSGVIVDLQYLLLLIFSFYLCIYLFLFLPNLGKSETFSFLAWTLFPESFETRSTTDLILHFIGNNDACFIIMFACYCFLDATRSFINF